jgi:hypothetical protein
MGASMAASFALRFAGRRRVAFVVAAAVACAWLNQGPASDRYDALAAQAGASPLLRAWLPFAFAYRRSADEELYFAIARAIVGRPYDRALLLAKRGDAPQAFGRLPGADGRWNPPYASVPFEYPAMVLPFVLLPALISPSFAAFAFTFGAIMGALMLASVALALRAAPRTTDRRRAAGWWLAAALFLAQGGLLVQRVDALVAFFLALALWAAGRRRAFVMGLGVGLAAAVKVLPLLVLFPMMAVDRGAWRSPAAIARAAAGLALGVAAGFVPMLAISPSGFADFVRYHALRGLHVESTYGTVLSIVGLAGGSPKPATLGFGSFNLDGTAAHVCASASLPVLVLATAALTAWLAGRSSARGESQRVEDIACAGLGGLLCIWLFAKVFSPQYMTWGIPFVVAASTRRPGPALGVALGVAMAISQAYLRGFYDQVVDMRPLGVFALGMRLLSLVAMAALVVRELADPRTPSHAEPA